MTRMTDKRLAEVAELPEKWLDKYHDELNSTGFRADEQKECADELTAILAKSGVENDE